MRVPAKGNWSIGLPGRGASILPEQTNRKAVFEPEILPSENDRKRGEDNETDANSTVHTDEWVNEDDRASDSIAPSIMSGAEIQCHRTLMQQPPRSSIYRSS